MPRRSDVVWEAASPHPRLAVHLEAAAAFRYHYARLFRLILTGKDSLK